ncbi:MAG: hypothetical protein A3G59_02945 [Candidatus Taylorbacteria bacterium RIFCSPLOWO2_12_FULL_47_20]|uniref:Transcriptional repressor PaaX-like central Cas2-like domain-containing protein n=1 Tax=Candidatus Taylorbacteria bacterium RIFCSPLOWO2_12_FULL_47_20 TaxID=1802335 RepID=A0A1G2P661_9BACT|nr:MAG: hypothetical protein A3G59_02945 [Candidatus Taylorbacteria bacterium RIFCSPLOWO2_12_FULL_47_20]
MGEVERKSAKKRKRNNVKKIVLATVKALGFVSVALMAPNALQYMERLGLTPSGRQREVINRARDRLLKKKLLTRNSKGFLELTNEGIKQLRRMELSSELIPYQEKWDHRWRILIFDIPEKRKYLREKIRNTLACLGFLRLQDSVWIIPYDCEDLITLLKADFKVGKDLLYVVVEEIENGKHLEEFFNL